MRITGPHWLLGFLASFLTWLITFLFLPIIAVLGHFGVVDVTGNVQTFLAALLLTLTYAFLVSWLPLLLTMPFLLRFHLRGRATRLSVTAWGCGIGLICAAPFATIAPLAVMTAGAVTGALLANINLTLLRVLLPSPIPLQPTQ